MINNFTSDANTNSWQNKISDTNLKIDSLPENLVNHTYLALEHQNNFTTKQAIKNNQGCVNKLACFYNRQAVYVVKDDQEKQAIIAHYHKTYPQDKLAVIKTLEDLSTNNIIKKISYNAKTGVNIVNGDLLDSAAFTLVLDLSAMIASEISSLNELLDKSPKYEGKLLNDNIRIAVMITNDMLFKKSENTPGSDCWRRLQQLSKFIYAHDLKKQDDFNNNVVDNKKLLETYITNINETPKNSQNNITIDFMVNQSWEELLFGSIALDENGKLYFQQSKLIEAKDNCTIILQNAPWHDTKFKDSIAGLIRYNKFTTNCDEIELPLNINFVSYDINKQQLLELKQQFLIQPSTIDLTNYICLNSTNIEQLFSNIQYTDSRIKKTNRLLELTGIAKYIVITEKLTNSQWLKLISLLKQTPNGYKIIELEKNKKLLQNNKVQLINYSNQEHMLEELKPNYDLAYQITPQTNWDDIWQLLEMSSQKNLKFDIKSSELLQAAITGKRILLYGLEKNINLCKNLESLLANNPYLFINGNKILLPNLQLTIAVTADFTATTTLWQQLEHNVLHLDNPTDKYVSLFTKLVTLPESTNKKYLNKRPWHDSDFSKIIEKQVRLELIKDNVKQATMKHYQQALNILIAEAYKEDAEIYAYITIVIADYCETLPNMANKQQLAQWLAINPQATKANITDDFWQLLAYCPINDYPQLIPSNFDDIENTKDACINLILNYLIQSVPKEQQQYWQQRFEYTEELTNADKCAVVNNTSIQPTILEQQQQKLKDLTDLVITHPILFFKGDAGSGKSFMAQSIAKNLKQIYAINEAAITLNIGPKTSVEDIFGTYKLVTKADDSYLEFIDGPILQWAKNENPPLLIIDEANLAAEGVLAPLAGLSLTPPTIDFQGVKYTLTAKHRIILTGNFNSYSGRNMDSSLNSKALCIHFDAMSPQQLIELIVKTNLPENWQQNLKQRCIQQIMLLYSHYNKIYNNSLSARDLHSILIRLNTTIKFNSNNNITLAQINSLVWQSCFDTLARNLTNEKNINKLQSLQDWYNIHYNLDDSIITAQELAFNSFLTKLRLANNDIDLFIKPMTNLVRDYWLFLESNARKGMIVEGPAGYGKDCVLSRVLLLWQQTQHDLQFIHINANLNNIDQLVNYIDDAKNKGKTIIISELNILPSELLEGILNSALTGDSHANFKLFATINSVSEVNGRQELSNAFKNRCTKVKLKIFSRDDYYQLLQRRSLNTELNNYIATYFFVLSKELTNNKSPVQLCVDDLFRVADALITLPENMWQQTITAELYLASLFIEEDKLTAAITRYNNQSPIITAISLHINSDNSPKPIDSKWLFDIHNKALTLTTYNNQSTNDLQLIAAAISKHINNNRSEPIVVNLVENSRLFFDIQAKVLTLQVCNNNSIADYIDAAYFIINEASKPKLLRAVSDEIPTIYYNDYFDTNDKRFSPREYRLEVENLTYDNDKIELYVDTFMPTAMLNIPDFPKEQLLLNINDQIGVFTVNSSNTWEALPGFTPNDRLKYLECDYPVLVTKCENTGQLYIKIITNGATENITIKFLIETDDSYFQNVNSSDTMFNQEEYNHQLKQWLNDNIFSYKNSFFNSCVELQAIQQITNKASQINSLVNWCKSFDATKYIEINTTEDLQDVIYNKIGVCRHRALVFLILAEYFNIKARIISNSLHSFIEIQLQNGQYKKLDLGGGQANVQKIENNCKHNIDYKKSINNNTTSLKPMISKYTDPHSYELNKEYFELELIKIINSELVSFNAKELVFMFNQLNFADYFIEYIKNIIVKYNYTSSITTWFHYFFENKDQIFIPEEQYNYLLASVMLFSDYIKTSHILLILEYLTSITVYAIQAQQLLNNYYQPLAKHQQLPLGNKKIIPQKKVQITESSYDLTRFLQKTKVEKKWSYTSNGFAPNINRLIELKPAFLHTVINSDNTIFLPMRFPILEEIYYACKYRLPKYDLTNKENFFYIAISFFEFLFGSLNNYKFKIIAFDDDYYEHPVTKEKINIMKGVYNFPEALDILIYSSLKSRYDPDNYIYKLYQNVNIQTLRAIYNEPTGIILNRNIIKDATDIFLDLINYAELAKQLS